jgi:pimeloyl-ACP methyl ester carboxylesterase
MPRYPALSPIHMSLPASDGVILRGHLTYPHGNAGTRYPLAVLAHQYPATRDSYAPLCADLHALGVATLAFDLRGHGDSIWTTTGARIIDTPALPTMEAFGTAFMASAAKAGFAHIADDIVRVASWGMCQNFIDAARVTLVGASVGGTGALLAAPRIGPSLGGVLTLGAAGALAHGADAPQRIRANCEASRTPILLATSRGDPFDGAKVAAAWSAGLSHVRTLVVPGDAHAMAIYYDVRKEVLQFLRAALRLGGPSHRKRAAPARTHGAARRRS